MRKYFADYSKLEAKNLKNLNENKLKEIKIENINQLKISKENSSQRNFPNELKRKLNKGNVIEISSNDEKKNEILKEEKKIESKSKNGEEKIKLNFEIEKIFRFEKRK